MSQPGYNAIGMPMNIDHLAGQVAHAVDSAGPLALPEGTHGAHDSAAGPCGRGAGPADTLSDGVCPVALAHSAGSSEQQGQQEEPEPTNSIGQQETQDQLDQLAGHSVVPGRRSSSPPAQGVGVAALAAAAAERERYTATQRALMPPPGARPTARRGATPPANNNTALSVHISSSGGARDGAASQLGDSREVR